ncbi:MAG: type II toxin-antitoxin system CcdA family antitoxin [Xanthomonadaceae bacterium]|nr:type II toxin-antitoxin system CcdA family antitoxin [Xanthomonadaceae bacterium]
MSTAAVFDASARKRPVNLSLNEDLVAQACQLTDNLSMEVENLLADFVARQRNERDGRRDSLQRAAVEWRAFHEKHGSLSDEFSPL